MDPASIMSLMATSVELSKAVSSCAVKLYKFIRSASVVDETLKSLYQEVDGLHRIVVRLYQTLNIPAVRTHQTLALWSDIEGYLAGCHTTVDSLQGSVTKLLELNIRDNKILTQAAKQIKLDLVDTELKEMREQIKTRILEIQLTLEMILVNITTMTPDYVIATLGPKVDNLEKLVNETNRRLRLQHSGNPQLDQKRERLALAAGTVAEDARTVIFNSGCVIYSLIVKMHVY